MSRVCFCPEWGPNMKKLNGIVVTAAIRTNAPHYYDGKVFSFCPWCGRELMIKPEGDVKERTLDGSHVS